MKTLLIALVALPAGVVPGYDRQINEGDTFETDPEFAEKLLTEKQAKLANQPVAGKKERTLKARVLVDGAHGKANDLVELPEGAAKQAEKEGQVDTDKAAVTYAASLDQNKPKA